MSNQKGTELFIAFAYYWLDEGQQLMNYKVHFDRATLDENA